MGSFKILDILGIAALVAIFVLLWFNNNFYIYLGLFAAAFVISVLLVIKSRKEDLLKEQEKQDKIEKIDS